MLERIAKSPTVVMIKHEGMKILHVCDTFLCSLKLY